MHVIVENQLAINDPPEVRPTLKRLVEGGLTRHEAIHAIGSVVAEALFKVMKERVEFDRALIGVNYFCRLATTILAGRQVDQSGWVSVG